MSPREVLLHSLHATKEETINYFQADPESWEYTYAPGKWTIRQLLVHLADAEAVLLDRIKRVIAEPRGVQWAFDQAAWAAVLNYTVYPLHLAQELYSASRNNNIYLAELFFDKFGSYEFVHSETGVRTLRMEMEKVAHHNENHLVHIRNAFSRTIRSGEPA